MFTPGPWKWSCHKQGDVLITRLGNEKTEAMVIYGSGTTICCHQHDQNLIAAAPEMYKLLEKIFKSGALSNKHQYIAMGNEVAALLDQIDNK